MNANAPAAKVPATYWIAALLSLLWNSYGGYDYLMTKWRNLDYLTANFGTPELARQMLDIVEAAPLWAHALWGLGIWASVLGSLLLLARSRFAAPAFLASLLGAAGSFAHQFTRVLPEGLDTTAMKVMPPVILAVIALQWWWARRKAADGSLR